MVRSVLSHEGQLEKSYARSDYGQFNKHHCARVERPRAVAASRKASSTGINDTPASNRSYAVNLGIGLSTNRENR